jgi:hypothetical protein
MKHLIEEEETLVRKFLLGELPPEEGGQVEERLFLDVEFFRQVQAAQDELVDEYLYGDLPADERERFEKRLLSRPELREDLKVAKALQRYTKKNSTSSATVEADGRASSLLNERSFFSFLRVRRPALAFSLAAALLLIALAGFWLMTRVDELREPRDPPLSVQEKERPMPSPEVVPGGPNREGRQQEQASSNKPVGAENSADGTGGRNGQPRKPVPPARNPPPAVYSFVIIPVGPVREGAGEVNRVSLPPEADFANLRLPLLGETAYRRYTATLRAEDSSVIQAWEGLKATGREAEKFVSVRVPAKTLSRGNYSILLRGVSADGSVREISSYYFQVAK